MKAGLKFTVKFTEQYFTESYSSKAGQNWFIGQTKEYDDDDDDDDDDDV